MQLVYFLFNLWCFDYSSVQTVVGGGGGNHMNHPVLAKDKLKRLTAHYIFVCCLHI